MKISTRGRYAIRMLQDMADHEHEGYVTLKDIAERQGISKKYLEQIAMTLAQGGVLNAARGHRGGYKLNGKPEDWTIYRILVIVEGSMAPVACLEGTDNPCARKDQCVTLPVWTGLDRVIREYLEQYTLKDLISKAE